MISFFFIERTPLIHLMQKTNQLFFVILVKKTCLFCFVGTLISSYHMPIVLWKTLVSQCVTFPLACILNNLDISIVNADL